MQKRRLNFFTQMMVMVALFPMVGCDLAQNHLKMDRSTNLEFQDYRDGMAAREVPSDSFTAETDIPDLQSYVAGVSENLKPMPLVSLSINQSIPLRDALFELAKQADYDIELDPRITGSIIFTAKNRPFDTVIQRISDVAGLRYKFEEDIVRVELDTPYTKNYKIDYLGIIRKNEGSINTSVGVSSGSGGVTAGSGSSFSISSTLESNFWSELETNVKSILASNDAGGSMKTQNDPDISVSSTSPQAPVMPLPVPPVDESQLNGNAPASVSPQAGDETSSIVSTLSAAQQVPAADANVSTIPPSAVPTNAAPTNAPGVQPAPIVAPPNTVLQVQSLPAGGSGDTATAAAAPGAGAVAINRQAGLITVYANERVHQKIADYLEMVRKSTTSQVLIEAKVLEVTLSDEFATGVNWSALLDDALGGELAATVSAVRPAFPTPSANAFSISLTRDATSNVISALSRYGTVHALASPRVTVMNNQPALLSVAENEVYFELDVETEVDATSGARTISVDSEIRNVPEGVLINVLPSIDLERQQISMQVRPTVTRITRTVSDPSVPIALAQIDTGGAPLPVVSSDIPVLNVQEMDSVLRMNSGQIIVMGGLLQDRAISTRNGVPVLTETPIIGGLFRNHADQITKTELVIFLKTTILNQPNESVTNTDRDVYRTFGQDRRPSKM